MPSSRGIHHQCIDVIAKYRRNEIFLMLSSGIKSVGHHSIQCSSHMDLDSIDFQSVNRYLLICTRTKLTRSIIIRSHFRKIAGVEGHAPHHFQFITYPITIRINETSPSAVNVIFWINAGCIIRIGRVFEITSQGIRTTRQNNQYGNHLLPLRNISTGIRGRIGPLIKCSSSIRTHQVVICNPICIAITSVLNGHKRLRNLFPIELIYE